MSRDGRQIVFVVKDAVVTERVVEAVSTSGPIQAVHGLLTQADEVVVAPPADLRAGAPVTIRRRTL